jgi:hypothetical protein
LNNDYTRSKINATNNLIRMISPEVKGEKMAEQPDELKKLAAITTDLEFTVELRIKAIEQLGTIGSHEALLALLDVVANERLTAKERELALERAGKIIKSSH